MTEETKNNHDVKRLEIAHNIREFHHKSLWEEEKHFTWFVSIVLSTQILIYTSNSLCNQSKLIFIFIAFLVGIFLCITAFRVLRKEGEYFHNALSRFVKEYNSIYTTSPLPDVPEKSNKNIRELIKLFLTCKIGVRDSFQFLFLFFILIFVGILFSSFLTLKG